MMDLFTDIWPENDVEALSLGLALMISADAKIHDQKKIDVVEAYTEILWSKLTYLEQEQAKANSLKLLGLEQSDE
tara:strand:- start:140 stop:364 length:225 start_codon:yes stop_codon:yes gene_type:complete